MKYSGCQLISFMYVVLLFKFKQFFNLFGGKNFFVLEDVLTFCGQCLIFLFLLGHTSGFDSADEVVFPEFFDGFGEIVTNAALGG